MSSTIRRRDVLRGILGLGAALSVAPLAAACGGSAAPAAKTETKPATESKPAQPAAQAAATKPAESKPAESKPAQQAPAKASGIELVYLNQSRGQAKAMETLAERYTQQTGIKVTIDSPGPTDYPKKLQAASQAGNMPDMYYAIGAADMAPYFKAGWALDLKPELEKGWNKNFSPGVLDFVEFKEGNAPGVPPGIYQAPWEVNSYALLYNPALLEKGGLDPKKLPTTSTDWLDMLKKLKAANVGTFATANEFIPRFLQAYASGWLTDEQINDTFSGKTSWKADGWKNALNLFVQMRDADVVFNNTLNAGNPDMEKSFFNIQELAMFYTGVFSVPVQVTTAPNFTAYSAFALPKGEGATMDPRPFGGPGKNGVVNAKGKNVEESVKFIKWLTEKEQEQTFMEMVPLIPTNPAAVDASKLSPQLSLFAELAPKIQKVPAQISKPVDEALRKGVQSILLKEKTPDQVLDDVDKAQKG